MTDEELFSIIAGSVKAYAAERGINEQWALVVRFQTPEAMETVTMDNQEHPEDLRCLLEDAQDHIDDEDEPEETKQ